MSPTVLSISINIAASGVIFALNLTCSSVPDFSFVFPLYVGSLLYNSAAGWIDVRRLLLDTSVAEDNGMWIEVVLLVVTLMSIKILSSGPLMFNLPVPNA